MLIFLKVGNFAVLLQVNCSKVFAFSSLFNSGLTTLANKLNLILFGVYC